MNKQISTYSFSYYNDKLFDLCKEAGEIYSASLDVFWEVYKKENKWLSKFDLQKEMKKRIERKNLHSDSYLAAMQQVHANIATWKEGKKINPDAKAPYKTKFLQPIFFKKSQIKYRNGQLILTLDKNKNYIVLRWSREIPLPIYGQIGYNKRDGWKISLIVEKEIKEEKLNYKKGIAIDLGVKRIATLFDGEKIIMLSGKKLKALSHYRNKTNANYQQKLSKKKKGSKNYKKLQRARRKSVCRMNNIKEDILHKQSRFIVNYAINRKIGNIVFGDNASTHNNTNCGKKNNQSIQQFPEQQLRKYVEYKFESVSGFTEKKPEPYTSQRCPICKNLYKTQTRIYKCKKCGFTYDRDGVGAINIYKENVSSIENGRICRLTRPFGIRFKNDLSFKLYKEKLNSSKGSKIC